VRVYKNTVNHLDKPTQQPSGNVSDKFRRKHKHLLKKRCEL